jgi:hypothetical protein
VPAKFDHRTFVRMDHGLPEHPKFVGLSDRAFRVWFEAVCWCSRQERNGDVPTANAKRLGLSGKALRELLDARLVEQHADGYQLHDYLDFQRSKEEIDAFRSARGDAGSLGNHKRWHVARRRSDKDCQHCKEEGRIGLAN